MMTKSKVNTIILHCIGWLLFFILPVIFIISQSFDGNSFHLSANIFTLVSISAYIFIFYFHTYFLFPRLFLNKKRGVYFLGIVALLLVVYFLRPYDSLSNQNRPERNKSERMDNRPPFAPNHPPPPGSVDRTQPAFAPGNKTGPGPRHLDIISIALFILVITLSVVLVLEKRWRIAVQETARAEADKANAELSFLKAQINPHFLFNTLNNIYSLAVTKNENVTDAIMKLSNIMRYVTDDVNEEFVSLEKEVDAISDYISLQRLRLGKKATIDFIAEGNISAKKIAPLILMPFVENVFKHGISNASASDIVIKLTASDKEIIFYTANKLFATPRNTDRTGIGVSNTKKRLEQIYPNKYLLEIASQNGLFTVRLVMYI